MTRHSPYLLLVEDDVPTARMTCDILTAHFGYERIVVVGSVADAIALDLERFDLVLSNIHLPDGSGLDLLDRALHRRDDLPFVMVTSESTMETAMRAIRLGAYDYIVKVGDYMVTIPLVVEKNLEVWQIKQHNRRLRQQLEQTLEDLSGKNRQLEHAVAQLERQATTDPLTGLANRRSIQDTLERRFAETQRHHTDLTCAMIDLDAFKPLNDTLGHQKGDALLKTAARVLEANCRRSDVAGRYGGDEFVLILPNADLETARQVARRIQHQFRQATHVLLPVGCQTGMSVGLASVRGNRPTHADQLVALADVALYQAKAAGKGCVVINHAVAVPNGS